MPQQQQSTTAFFDNANNGQEFSVVLRGYDRGQVDTEIGRLNNAILQSEQQRAEAEQRMADGALDQWRGRQALRQLRDIKRIDQDYRSYDGRLSEDQRRDILARLDQVRAGVVADARYDRSY